MKNNRILIFILSVILIFTSMPMTFAVNLPISVEVPINISFKNATGIDINLRLNPDFVEKAEIVKPAPILANAVYLGNPNGAKYKVSIASANALNNEGTLFYLKLTLKKEATENDELCKVLQLKVNESITYKADNCVLLSGVKENTTYEKPVIIGFNEGTATLNGKELLKGAKVIQDGDYVLKVTDLIGNVRVVNFTIKKNPPVPQSFTSSVYLVNQNNLIKNIKVNTSVKDCINNINEKAYIKAFNSVGEAQQKDMVYTGMQVKIVDVELVKATGTLIVEGDVNGDGKITEIDYNKSVDVALGKEKYTEEIYKEAGDTDNDGVFDVLDCFQIARQF